MATTTNQEQGIASKTSGHTAETTGPTDVCFNPPKKVPVPHPNVAPTNVATLTTSAKTKIAEGEIVRVYDKIGPPSDPAHGDTGGGVVSGTYRREAVPQAGGPSISAEGKWPTRTNDPTTQNHANTSGKMMTPASKLVVDPLAEQKAKLCTLVSVDLTCLHGRKAGKTRVLEVWGGSAPTPGSGVSGQVTGAAATVAPDVTDGEQVTIVSLRQTVDGKPAACKEGNKHTLWRLARRGGGFPPLDKEIRGKNTIKVPGDVPDSWLNDWDLVMKSKTKVGSATDAGKDAMEQKVKEATLERGRQTHAAQREANGLPPKPRDPMAGRQEANQNAAAARAAAGVDGAPAKTANQNLSRQIQNVEQLLAVRDFVRIWNADKDPLTVVVQAFACSGSETYVIRAYPAGTAGLEFTPWLEKVKGTVKLLQKVCDGIAKLCSYGGISLEAEYRVLALKLSFELKWAEVTAAKNGLEPWMMKKKGAISIGGELLGVTLSVGIPIGYLLGPLGSVATKLLNKIGARADVKLSIKIGLNVTLDLKYDDNAWGGGCSVTGPFEIFFGISLKLGDDAGIEGGCVVAGKPDFKLDLAAKPPVVNLAEGAIKIGFRGKIWVDIWWWTVEHEETYWPDGWQVRYAQKRIIDFAFLNG